MKTIILGFTICLTPVQETPPQNPRCEYHEIRPTTPEAGLITCMVHGQQVITDWVQRNKRAGPEYWRVRKWKCYIGRPGKEQNI